MRPSTFAASFLALIAPFVAADVEFTVPAAGATITGTSLTITWIESGTQPAIGLLDSYVLYLYSGSNTSPTPIGDPLVTAGDFATGYTVTVTLDATAGGDTANAYFLGMVSTATAGGSVTNYSDRFTLASMTGSFTTAVTTALEAVSGTTGPDTINDVTDSTTTTSAAAAETGNLYTVSYYLQTGLTRYAPMQPLPPTSITATNTSPQYPTSSVSTATTFLVAPTVVTTLTQAGTYSFSSHANTASAAAQPSDDMAKFLNRWKD